MSTVYFVLALAAALYILYKASEWAAESAFQRQISKKSNALDKEDRAKMRRAWCEYPNTERQSIYLDRQARKLPAEVKPSRLMLKL